MGTEREKITEHGSARRPRPVPASAGERKNAADAGEGVPHSPRQGCSEGTGLLAKYRAYQPPRISRASLRWNNRVAAATTPLEFDAAGQSWRLQLLPWFVPSRGDTRIGLELTAAGEPCQLILGAWPLRERLEKLLPQPALTKLPVALRTSVVEAALAPLLEAAERALGVTLEVTQLPLRRVTSSYTALGFSLRGATDRTHGVLLCSQALVPLLEVAFQRWPAPSATRWDHLCLPLALRIGTLALTRHELGGLAWGDVLLVPGKAYADRNTIQLYAGTQRIGVARRSGRRCILEQAREDAMEQDTAENIASVDDLAVTLVFDIGSRHVSLGELRQLQPGYTLLLESDLSELVKIRNQNRTIGVGEIVQVGELLGVRIVKLFERDDGHAA